MKRTGIFLGAGAACAVAAGALAQGQHEAREAARSTPAASPKPAMPVADAVGNLHVPSNYASLYEYLGTWAVAADKGAGAKEMHIIYASPGAIAAFKRTGHFPQGTVLVKEVREAATAPMTTGTVSHPTKLKGWFVAVRDVKNSHPANKLWGDGWGWSWFDADKPLHTTSTDYHNDCLGCHEPAKATDWMYTPGYSVLQH